jgi:TolB-like protein/DNA-binding winged helix-turn-helix (wHTH) protein/Flp pilus assembly protein TadD
MDSSSQASGTVRFGPFAADLRAGELRKDARKIKLQEKPFQLLAALLERPGEVVRREELQQRLWPADTFVDFDHGLNIAIAKLREALEDSAEHPRFIETLPKRGYRFLALVERAHPATGVPPVDAAPFWRRKSALRILALAVLTVAVATYLAQRWIKPPPSARAGKVMLVVLPFENLSGDPQQEFFSDGLTEEMIAQLGQVNPQALGVIARTSAMRYKTAKKDVAQIGRELNVEYLLEGSVRREGDRIRVTAQLIQVEDRTHLWAQTYEREAASLFAIQRDVADQVTQALRLQLLPGERAAWTRQLRADPAAHESYLQGRHLWNKRTPESVQKAVLYFEEAVRRDPSHARAYAGLSDCFNLLASYSLLPPTVAISKAKAAATRALELDPALAEAHASLGFSKLEYDWDWTGAKEAFEEAIQLDPNYATARQWYSLYLNAIGRSEEAIAEAREALRLDPLSPVIAMAVGSRLYHARRFDEAIEQFRKTLELDPNFVLAHHNLGRTHLLKGQYPQAVEALEVARRLSGDQPARKAALGYAYALAGRQAEARSLLRELKKKDAPSFPMALLSLSLGEKQDALAFLEKAYKERHSDVTLLIAEPLLDPLRDHPGFQDLLRRVGLPP